METGMRIKPGDRIFLHDESRPYRVQVCDERYAICTKPFNLRHTVRYFIIDGKEEIRGPDDRVFCEGYETAQQCEDRLRQLQRGEIAVSRRKSVQWIEKGRVFRNPDRTDIMVI